MPLTDETLVFRVNQSCRIVVDWFCRVASSAAAISPGCWGATVR